MPPHVRPHPPRLAGASAKKKRESDRLRRLAHLAATCDAPGMKVPPRNPSAGGFPIAAGALGGTAIGLYAGQPTIGFLAGLALGAAIAVAIWWRER